MGGWVVEVVVYSCSVSRGKKKGEREEEAVNEEIVASVQRGSWDDVNINHKRVAHVCSCVCGRLG